MGKNGYFTEEEIIELKKGEQSGGGGGCRGLLILIGLLVMAAGFYVIFFVEGQPSAIATVSETALLVSETAVSTSATPTLAPTATATPSATLLPTVTATAVPTQTPWPTSTPIPTNTALPTHTPYPTHTPQPTHTAEPTHTAQPTYTPYPTATATERPFLAPVAVEAEPPNGNALPAWLPWLVGSLVGLLLVTLIVLAYVSHQMRPPTPVLITPEGIPVDGTYGVKLPPPTHQPIRETPAAPVRAPVTPVSPPDAPVQNGNAAPPETIQVQVTPADESADEATMRAICVAWNEIEARGERPSLNKLCTEYFGGKNSERMAIARRAVKWGRANGLIGGKNQKEVKPDETNNQTRSETRERGPWRQQRPFGTIPNRLKPPRPN